MRQLQVLASRVLKGGNPESLLGPRLDLLVFKFEGFVEGSGVELFISRNRDMVGTVDGTDAHTRVKGPKNFRIGGVPGWGPQAKNQVANGSEERGFLGGRKGRVQVME